MPRLVAFLVAVVVLSGCAGLQRETFIHEQVGEYIYDRPITQVWPHVVGLMGEEGFSFKKHPTQYLLTTEWKEEMSSSSIAASFTRYLVEAVPLGEDHTRVRIMRNSMSMGGGPGVVEGPRHVAAARAYATPTNGGRNAAAASGTRDLRMEWELLKRAAPDDAAELQEVADGRFR